MSDRPIVGFPTTEADEGKSDFQLGNPMERATELLRTPLRSQMLRRYR